MESPTSSIFDLHNQLGGVELESPNEVDKLDNIQPPFPEFDTGDKLPMNVEPISQLGLRKAELGPARLQSIKQSPIAVIAKPRSGAPNGHAVLCVILTAAQKLCDLQPKSWTQGASVRCTIFQMAKLPDLRRVQQRRSDEPIDAEWEEVDDSQTDDDTISLFDWLKAEISATVNNGLKAIGILVVAILIVVMILPGDGEGEKGGSSLPSETEATTAPLALNGDIASTGVGGDEWNPSMLCSDAQVLENVEAARRQWMVLIMTDMAQEGSYILPQTGDPLAEGERHMRLSWPSGTQFLGMRDSGGAFSNDAIEISCQGDLEIRDAFKLPDGTWSPVYVTVPASTFLIKAGAEGFSVDFRDLEREEAEAVFHIAGTVIPLQRMREISMGR